MENKIEGIHISESEIAKTCRVKVYPDCTCEVMASEKPIFRASGWEDEKPMVSNKTDRSSPSAEALERSRRRAIARIRDYALCSDFEWFVTLTLSPDQIDRHDYDAAVKKLGIYCSNRVQRHGLRYVIVTEKHKDGALHFHGFMAGLPLSEFAPSGTYTGGIAGEKPKRPRSAAELAAWTEGGAHEVYNLTSWRLGFTTAVLLERDYRRAITYVSKYIRKAPEKVGGRWYLSGGALKLPVVYTLDVPITTVQTMPDAYTFDVPGCGYSIWRGKTEQAAALLADADIKTSLSDL